MFKNFSKNVALGACLASMLMINGGWGMEDIEKANWIGKHADLIEQACYDEASFDLLIKELFVNVEPKKRASLYKTIEEYWNDRNVFEAIVLDNGTFATYRKEYF